MTCEACRNWVEVTDLHAAPYIIRTCRECSRRASLRPPGEHGIGIEVQEGDQPVFPPEFLALAANPLKGTGHFTRHGIAWFAHLVFGADEVVRKRDDVVGAIKEFITECEKDWEKSPLVSGVFGTALARRRR
jgi:hypothetical protein